MQETLASTHLGFLVQNDSLIGFSREPTLVGALWPLAPTVHTYLSSADLTAQLLPAALTRVSESAYRSILHQLSRGGAAGSTATKSARSSYHRSVRRSAPKLRAACEWCRCGSNSISKQSRSGSRAALGLQNVFEAASLSSCHALFRLGAHGCQTGSSSIDNAQRIVSLAL